MRMTSFRLLSFLLANFEVVEDMSDKHDETPNITSVMLPVMMVVVVVVQSGYGDVDVMMMMMLMQTK